MSTISRRRCLARGAAAVGASLLPDGAHAHTRSGAKHPTPRPGITAAKVLTAKQLVENEDAIPVFDGVRRIPGVIDGIRCNCGCAGTAGKYSLLSCFEGQDAMGKWCPVCQGQARLAVRLHDRGKSLAEIRAAVDAKFG